MRMSDDGLTLLRKFESCRTVAYQDSVGVWTIGYGWTQPINGVSVHQGMTISRMQAEDLLSQGIAHYEQAVQSLVTVPLSQQQFDALVDFTYNTGIQALAYSTLLKRLNAGDYAAAADEFLRWNRAGGRVLAGLARRRHAERERFLS
ncbi:lysozyme [Enterobacter sp. 22466]|uniref:lysozyme n=1 Tax=Enterobacter sp. 22466 TaxID=3453924 RepID=UPI003F834EF4